MADRDEKGKFAKGNKYRLSAEQARINGAKGGSVTKINRIQKWIEAMEQKGAHNLSTEEMETLDKYLLTLTLSELGEIHNAPDVPVVIKSRAKQLLDPKKTFDTSEKMLDRAFGKPKQKTENETTVKGELNMKDDDPYADMPIESQERIAKVILEERHKHYKATHDAKKDTDE